MQSSLTYGGEKIKGNVGFVQESKKHYNALLDAQINEYIQQLRDVEVRCSRPGADKEKLQVEISALNETMLQACAQFEQQVNDPFVIKAAQVDFREKTNNILAKSYLIKRCRTWPQGHQGDYNTLEMTYKNVPMSEGIGYYLDKYLLSTTLADGVRGRIVKLRDLVRDEMITRKNSKILDVACGSCREVFELAPEIKTSGAEFTCVDLDEDALNFALDRFSLAGLSDQQVEVRKYNALRIFDFETAVIEFGMQDIIYSVGYFDYLPDDFLIKMLKSLYKLLSPGGKIIAAFKDANRYPHQVFHWLVNWDGFLQRTEDDFERILHFAEIQSAVTSTVRVESGVIFYIVTKK